jgi:peptidoglycan hydrolase-like protein with peptidoglycan-binding domain
MSGPALQRGDEGPSVSALQLALAALGFDVGDVNGVFGDTTAAAVLRFQNNQGIAATGTVNDDTWAALAGQPFEQSQRTQISAPEFPSIARAIFFANDTDA